MDFGADHCGPVNWPCTSFSLP